MYYLKIISYFLPFSSNPSANSYNNLPYRSLVTTNWDRIKGKYFSNFIQIFTNTPIHISLQYHQNKIYDSHEIPLDDPRAYFKFHEPLRGSSDVKIAD